MFEPHTCIFGMLSALKCSDLAHTKINNTKNSGLGHNHTLSVSQVAQEADRPLHCPQPQRPLPQSRCSAGQLCECWERRNLLLSLLRFWPQEQGRSSAGLEGGGETRGSNRGSDLLCFLLLSRPLGHHMSGNSRASNPNLR